jgi:hypothetical protein
MTTNNTKTQISEPNPSNLERMSNSKDQTVLEKSVDELEFIQMEDEVKNILVTINNFMMNSRDVEGMVRHVWKAIEFHKQHYNRIRRESTN